MIRASHFPSLNVPFRFPVKSGPYIDEETVEEVREIVLGRSMEGSKMFLVSV